MFGKLQHVIDFELTPKCKLALSDSTKVYQALRSKGYYMQIPPTEIEKMGSMAAPPERLDNIF